MSSDSSGGQRETILVTGFPAWNAKRMIASLSAQANADILVLVRAQFERAANKLCASLGSHAWVIEGDVCDMDMGLSGGEFSDLAARVTTIYHLAGIYYPGVDRATTNRVNVEGTRGVIAFARECQHLRRLVHFSTAFVSGKRKGVVLEEELDEGQSFNNDWEESKFRAEMLARTASRTIPITVVRPGIVIGDSQTGEIGDFDGPHTPILNAIRGGKGLRLPLPARGNAPLHLVPIDYVTSAAIILGQDDRGAGGTFHLTDANPLPARFVFELAAELGRKGAPPALVSPSLVRTFLRAPGLERVTRAPRAVLDSLDHRCNYNSRLAARILNDYDIRCPSFDSYAEAIVAFALRGSEPRSRREIDDPLE